MYRMSVDQDGWHSQEQWIDRWLDISLDPFGRRRADENSQDFEHLNPMLGQHPTKKSECFAALVSPLLVLHEYLLDWSHQPDP